MYFTDFDFFSKVFAFSFKYFDLLWKSLLLVAKCLEIARMNDEK